MNQTLPSTGEPLGEVLYEEWFVSGRTGPASYFVRPTANNSLHVILTQELFTVTANLFLFRPLIRAIGMELSIPVNNIIQVKRLFLRRFEITYRLPSGAEAHFILSPWKTKKFEEALTRISASTIFKS